MSTTTETTDQERTCAEDIVITLYKTSGDLVNRVLKTLVEKCTPGAKVLDLCEEGDRLITEETSKIFKGKKDMKKGVAFPTCVSINNCVCHFSPLKSDPEILLKDGDMVKIDLGAHVDGFIAVAAHTTVVGASKENKVTGRKADVLLAAHYAAEIAHRLVRPSGENYAVTDAIQKVAESFKCKPISGMLSHQLKQFRIDGEKSIIQNPNEAQKKEHEKCEFEVNEVYAVDVLISSGEGKGREVDNKTTVFKKTEDIYQLKLKASRAFYSEVEKKFGSMPFTLRSCEDEKKAKMGLVETVTHKLVVPFNVLHEKDGEFVAQFKFTLLLLPGGGHRITGLPIDLETIESDCKLEDESLLSVLHRSACPKNKKNKKKKALAKVLEGDVVSNSPKSED